MAARAAGGAGGEAREEDIVPLNPPSRRIRVLADLKIKQKEKITRAEPARYATIAANKAAEDSKYILNVPRNIVHIAYNAIAPATKSPTMKRAPIINIVPENSVLPITIASDEPATKEAVNINITAASVSANVRSMIENVPTKPDAVALFENLDTRVGQLNLGDILGTCLPAAQNQTFFTKLVLIAGIDPRVALRIVCDGAHDYEELILEKGELYKNFLSTLFDQLNARLPAANKFLGSFFSRKSGDILTSAGNARPDTIASYLDNMERLPGIAGADQLILDQCLVAEGQRKGGPGQDCVSVFEKTFLFGAIAPIPDSITFNPLRYYVDAAKKMSFRALWGQSLPQFIDAAGTPTADTVREEGAMFIDLTKEYLSGTYSCANLDNYREFAEGPNTFTVHNYYGTVKHIFKRNVAIPETADIFKAAEARRGTCVEICRCDE
jgi:hypothetical protein